MGRILFYMFHGKGRLLPNHDLLFARYAITLQKKNPEIPKTIRNQRLLVSVRRKSITGNDCRDKKAGWEQAKQVSTVKKASVLFLRKSIKSACERTTPWLTVHAYWTMAQAKIIKKESRKIYKERQNAYKEEDQYIIIRWKGGNMKEDAVSQCPSRRMDMQQCQTD